MKNLRIIVGIVVFVVGMTILLVVNPEMIRNFNIEQRIQTDAQHDWTTVMSILGKTDVKIQPLSMTVERRIYTTQSDSKDYLAICNGKDELVLCYVYEFLGSGDSPVKK